MNFSISENHLYNLEKIAKVKKKKIPSLSLSPWKSTEDLGEGVQPGLLSFSAPPNAFPFSPGVCGGRAVMRRFVLRVA